MKKNIEKISQGNGITALVLGILGILLIFAPYFGLPLSILALVFSKLQNKIMKTGMSTAGKVLGIIGIVISGLMLLIIVFTLLVVFLV